MLRNTLQSFNGNYSGFIHLQGFGIRRNPFLKNNPDLNSDLLIFAKGGHDTKFYYAVAFDPFLSVFKNSPRIYSRLVDSPRLRFARIGYPLLINLFSAGKPQYFPQAMVWLILLSNCIAVYFLARILMVLSVNPIWALFYILTPGFTVSCIRVLPESISAAFLLGALYFYFKDRIAVCVVLLSAAILVRESNVIAVMITGIWEIVSRRKERGLFIFSSVLPYVGWKLFLTYRLFHLFGWSTLFYSPGVLDVPLKSIFNVFWNVQAGQYPTEERASAVFYATLLLSVFVFSLITLIRRRDLTTALCFTYSLVAVSLDYQKVWIGLANVERTTFEALLLFVPLCLKTKDRAAIFAAALGLLLLTYDLFYLTANDSFRAGIVLSGF